MYQSLRNLLLATALAVPVFGAQPLEIRFDTPPSTKMEKGATNYFGDASKFTNKVWESQAQPVGNGRIGAMVFGNPFKERFQFNDITLWTGGDNPSGGYDINEFGAFQNFGDLLLDMGGGEVAGPSDPVSVNGQEPSGGQDISSAGDGKADTKWCMEHKDKDVIWQIDLGKPQEISGYSFTSANDVPARDPRTWRFEGSNDGKDWVPMDKHENEAPFSGRGLKKDYKVATKKAYSQYRFVFSPAKDEDHFQIAEIALDGVVATASGAPQVDGFSRSLDLTTAIHTTTWKQDGVTYKREVFASKPDQVIVCRITADKPGKVAGSIRLIGGHGETSAANGADTIFTGQLKNDLRYAARVRVLVDGGKVNSTGGGISFNGNSATLLLAAATDYALDPAKKFRNGIDPASVVEKQLTAASAKKYDTLRSAHLADFQKLMGRVDLDLGAPPAGKSITARLEEYKKGATDPHLEALMYQFGRYMMISSSRDSLPANLQGLWNDNNKPAWNSDYHTNINIQMNYWGVETGNLSECAMPLFNWTDAMIPGSREATVKEFGAKTPGWTMRTSVNIFGGNGWQWNLPSSAWLAQHYWEHYAFTGDKKFLETTAWPVFRDVSEFWLDHLIEKNGKLVVPKGWSPEHGPREDGVAHDQQIVWDLFTNTMEAAAALGKKDALVTRITEAREKLLGPQVGSWGQIMEWTTERPELEKSGHRHTSHLFAVYPGRQITLSGTPDLAKAAGISLEARGTSGDSRRSWTWPWRAAMWARLGRPDKAGEMVRGLLTHNTLPNLFATHPPFQIDGNLGIVGGMGEMLVQSHAGEISILPAPSPSWKDGSFKGIKARGGFEIDATWKGGALATTTIRSTLGNNAVVRLQGNPATIKVKESSGRTAPLNAKNGIFTFPTKAGMSYEISF